MVLQNEAINRGPKRLESKQLGGGRAKVPAFPHQWPHIKQGGENQIAQFVLTFSAIIINNIINNDLRSWVLLVLA